MSSAAVQTSVTTHPGLGLAGLEYVNGPKTVITKIASEVIKFGHYVRYAGESCEHGDADAEINASQGGVALRDPTKPSGQYEIGDPVAIMIEGFVWVPTEEAVAVGEAVFVRHTAGAGGAEQGVFRNDADTATAATPAGAAWFKGGTSLAVLQLNTTQA